MSSTQRLRFVVPKAQAFVEALTALDVSQPVLLIGDGELANEVAALAASVGVALTAHQDLPDTASLARFRVLVFTEQDGECLGQLLLACLDLNDVCVIAVVTARHFSRMPLFVVSIPKAGTHLVYELTRALGYASGVELPDVPRPQTWYCVEYSNSHTVARDFFVDTVRRAPFGNRHHPAVRSPVLFAYRHPLDILVSEANYYHRDGKTAFSGYFDGLDFEERVARLMDDEWLLGSLRLRVGGFLPWLTMPNVIPASFEELVGEAGGGTQEAQHRLIWSILLKLQVDGCVAELADKVFSKDSATFHDGKIGAWRARLTPAQVAQQEMNCGDVIAAFGYSTQAEASFLPSHAPQHAARPLRFPAADFTGMPLTVVSCFMGCNLVRYADRFFAVPLSLGPVALEALPDAQRARLPVAETLDELKAILLIGRNAYDRQHASLVAAGEALADEVAPLAFWKNRAEPCLLNEYKGYNVVAWQGRYLALRQAIGPVDLSQNLAELIVNNPFGDVLVASDLDDLLTHVNGMPPAIHFAVEFVQREAVLSQRLVELEGKVVAIQQEHARMQAEAARREAVLSQRLVELEGKVVAIQQDHA